MNMTLLKIKHQPLFNENFNNAKQNFFAPFSSLYGEDSGRNQNVFIPVNIKESEQGFSLEIIAPGLVKEDFKISLDKNILTISADKKTEEKNNEKTIRQEYSFSYFNRSFTLTKQINVEGISAEYVNGVLLLNLPKQAEVKAPVKQIPIN